MATSSANTGENNGKISGGESLLFPNCSQNEDFFVNADFFNILGKLLMFSPNFPMIFPSECIEE